MPKPKNKDTRTSDAIYRRNRAKTLAPNPLICAWCGKPINKKLKFPHPLSPTADHINPVAKGGNNRGKLQPMHLKCNQQKNTSTHMANNNHTRPW